MPELGFAIPISEAKTILDDLIVNGYVSGRVSLGLTVSEIPETYRRFWGLPSGVVIESVTAGSNAYYAGLHAGDVICQLGDSASRTSTTTAAFSAPAMSAKSCAYISIVTGGSITRMSR